MKLVRYGKLGQERPALIDPAGRLRDVSAIIPDIDSARLASPAWTALRDLGDETALPDLGSADGVRLGPCVRGVGKIICLGLNERAHSAAIKAGSDSKPIIFLKATSSISGAQDAVIYPKIGQKLDWETELAVVIGKRCKYVANGATREVIAGYCILNDMSDRHWQGGPQRQSDSGCHSQELRHLRALGSNVGNTRRDRRSGLIADQALGQ
jgi:2,4-diketo-3-deoxy-L-fuconate hydrolase